MRVKCLRYSLSLLLLTKILSAVCLSSTAQDTDIKFYNFFEAENFNNISIVCIFQDMEGFLWFGTYGGLYRYDGHTFKEFLPDPNNPNSLISGHVRSICQDTAGAIYIGTIDGLCIYYPETEKFKRFVHDPADPFSLSHNTIYKLFKDQSGTIWVGTLGGGLDKIEKTVSYNKQGQAVDTFRFAHHSQSHDENSISSNNIIDIAETPDGSLWIATQYGLNRFSKKENTFRHYLHDPDDPNSISNNNVSSLCVDKNGNIWAGTWEYGLNRMNPSENKFIRFIQRPTEKGSLSHDIIMELYCDHSGTIWVGTWGGGLNKIEVSEDYREASENSMSDSTYRFIHYIHSKSNPTSITGNSIYSIMEDRTGSMWVGTDWNGLNKFNTGLEKFKRIATIPGDANSLVNDVVFTLLSDRNSLLWIGTQNGLNTYNRITGKFTLFQNDPNDPYSLSHNQVRSIIEAKNGTIWVGTIQGLNKFDSESKHFIRYFENPEQPGLTHILSVYEDKKGYLWMGTYETGLMRFDPVHETFVRYQHDPDNPYSLTDNIVWAIVEDDKGILWIGTENGGLCEFDPLTERFTPHIYSSADSASRGLNTIYTLKKDNHGNIWAGTLSGLSTLVRNSAGEFSLVRCTRNLVNAIVEDTNHRLWLFTDKGLGVYNPADSSENQFSLRYAIKSPKFSINAAIPDPLSGEIYAGSINGYYIFDQNRFVDEPLPPVTKIVNLRIFNKAVKVREEINGHIILPRSISLMDKLEFSHKEYVISLEYAALYYQSPRDNQYAYMLDGFDKDWNYVGNQHSATYTNLPHGRYTFKVKAANPGGVWNNEPTSIELVIRPAWWKTLLFKVLLFILVATIALSINRVRIILLNRKRRELEATVTKRTEELSVANDLLTEKQEEITLQNDELLRHRNELERLVDERTRELVLAKDKAEESDRLKSAFLANMSHEIRTPLNAIVGFSDLLSDEDLDSEEKKSFIATIKNNSDTLLTLINDIMDISMIEANQLVLYKETFCVDELLTELKGICDLRNDKGLIIECCIDDPGTKTHLHSDFVRLRQVLLNLLNNAYKYTDKGSIRFGFKKEENTLRFFVEDTGIGISELNRMRIFEDFHKIEPYANRFHQGTGIGLSISRRLVHQMGGTISVESELSKGSVFSFTLPYITGQTDRLIVTSKDQKEIKLDKITIVVAEDDPDNYRLIEKLLKKIGSSIVWAKNGQEAVDYVRKHCNKNCIVLMDIKMPVMNGFEACAIIKEIDRSIPIIAVTAYAQKGDKEIIMKGNFDDFISKPLNFEKLWKSISRHQNIKPE